MPLQGFIDLQLKKFHVRLLQNQETDCKAVIRENVPLNFFSYVLKILSYIFSILGLFQKVFDFLF